MPEQRTRDPSLHAAKASEHLRQCKDALDERGASEAVLTDLDRLRQEIEYVIDAHREVSG